MLSDHEQTLGGFLDGIVNDLKLKEREGFDYETEMGSLLFMLHSQWIYNVEALKNVDINQLNLPLALKRAIKNKMMNDHGHMYEDTVQEQETRDSSSHAVEKPRRKTKGFINVNYNDPENATEVNPIIKPEPQEQHEQHDSPTPIRKSSSGMRVGTKHFYKQMLKNNRTWADRVVRLDPNYFSSRCGQQTPHVLWIGCSDSRVHPNDLTGLQPGEVFVHRNIANVCMHNDLNMLSCLQYAVQVLEVSEVIVVGHYGCGGVKFAMDNKHAGVINQWISKIKDTYEKNLSQLEGLDDDEKFKRLVELNVEEQVRIICKTSTIQKSWKKRISPEGDPLPRVHAWVYDLHDGIIHELSVSVNLPPFYQLEFQHDAH